MRKELNINIKKIIFVILAGGRSKRFGGGFKTFSLINNKSILDIIIEKLQRNKIEIFINVNESHEKFSVTKLPIILDKKKGHLGPLAGIHASMEMCVKNYPNKEWIFTVPSDTPFLPENILEKFSEKIDLNSDILIARSDNKIHPVVSMWRISLLKSIERELDQNNRKIMTCVEKHNHSFVDFESEMIDPFFNINTKEDLKTAENFGDQILKKSIIYR